MKKNYFALLRSMTLLLLLSSTLIACAHNNAASTVTPSEEKHVVILSMDGFRWDYTLDANTPTLDSLRRVGSYSQMMPVFPANTFPSHYSMATGLHPNNHGVTNNSFYDKVLGRRMSVFEADDCRTKGFWGGEPIWNTVELQGGIANIFMWPGSEYPINDRQASVWTPYDHNMDYFKRADMVVQAMSKMPAKLPNLVMWYMPDPDAVGHEYGPNSPECIARVEYIDSVLAYFFEEMRKTPYFDQINFIVTSDHGMTQLDESRYLNLYGEIDASKVIHYIAGSPFCFEVDEDYVDTAVEKLNALGHLRAYRGDSMPEEYHFGTHPTRCTNVVIIPDMGWKLDYYKGADRLPDGGGSHGYDPFGSDMQVVFYGVGPNFKEGYLQSTFQNQNIYLIICHLLGIEPAENDCVWEDIEGMFR